MFCGIKSCGQYLLLAAINRCVAASSKASLYEWYRHSVLHRLIPTSKSSLASQLSHLYPGNQNDSAMFGSITESLVARYRRLVRECEDVTLVFDGGNTSKGNMESLDKGPYHFVTSLTLIHHKDLLEIPLKGFNSFKDQRLKGTTAYRTTKLIWGKERTVVVTRSEELLSGQVAGIESALRKKRKAFRQLKIKLIESQQLLRGVPRKARVVSDYNLGRGTSFCRLSPP